MQPRGKRLADLRLAPDGRAWVGAGDHERDLAAWIVVGKGITQFTRRAAIKLFKFLADFTGDTYPSIITQYVSDRRKRLRQSVGTLIGDQRFTPLGVLGKQFTQCRRLARQKAEISETIAGQSRANQRCRERARARQWNDIVPALNRRRYQLESGIGDARRARIRNQRHVSVFQRGEHLVQLGNLVVLVIAGHGRVDVIMSRQDARCPRVFRGDQRDFAQDAQGAQRHVFQIAYRRWNDVECAHLSVFSRPVAVSAAERHAPALPA